jgi:hypothetical protein
LESIINMAKEYTIFGEGTSDEKLCEQIDAWMKDSETYHDHLLKRQNKALAYYHGDQTDKTEVPPHNSDTVFNRTFEAIETIIPIITGSAHQFIAIPAEENEVSLGRAQRVGKVLQKKYEDLEIRRKLENVSRDMIVKRFGVLEWGWDVDIDDVNVWVRDPRTIYIPKLRVDANELPYVIKIAEFDDDEMTRYFPDENIEDFAKKEKYTVSSETSDVTTEVYQVQVVYTPEYWVWKCDDKVLKKMPNPYWDFEGTEVEVQETAQSGKVKVRTNKEYANHLMRPQIPLIFFTPYTTGEAPISETSLTEVAMPIQDDINVAKRQILDNLRRMGNGQVYIDTNALPEEVSDAITNEPGLILIGNNLASENRIRRESATPIPGSHFSNLADSIAAFDNVFGVHGAIRGASNNETLGGQILDRQQNLSRIEQLTRELNRGVARLADGLIQMMKMYYTEEKAFKFLGNDGAIEFMNFINEDIEGGLVIDTKSGSAPTLDPLTRYNQAIQLWQLQAIDPETLFEKLEFPDPQLTAQKLDAWRKGQLLFESQVKQAEAAQQTELNVAAGQAQAAQQPAPEGEQPSLGGEQERNVESAQQVVQRAQQQTDGGSGFAPLQNTPNQ